MLQANFCHILSTARKFEQHTGGPKKLWQHATKVTVSSESACTCTLERREKAFSDHRKSLCGGKGGVVTSKHILLRSWHRSLSMDMEEQLEKGRVDCQFEGESSLRRTTGSVYWRRQVFYKRERLHQGWQENTLVFVKETEAGSKGVGVPLESEHVMRKLQDELPFPLLTKELPLFDTDGNIIICQEMVPFQMMRCGEKLGMITVVTLSNFVFKFWMLLTPILYRTLFPSLSQKGHTTQSCKNLQTLLRASSFTSAREGYVEWKEGLY